MRIGAHMSIEGGLERAVDRAVRAGCDVLQVFTKSSSQWKAKDLSEDEIARFKTRVVSGRIGAVSAHDSYLINLASPEPALHRRSLEALVIELERCEALGIPYLIAHPGAHTGSGLAAGIRRIAAAIDEAHAATPGAKVRLLLEITSGQGSVIGSRFDEIAQILGAIAAPGRLGVCFDTCHAFAAGYDIRTREGYERTFDEFDRVIGVARLLAFHLNDCKKDLGSRLDRHEHIGRGWIGLEAFRLLMNDSRFAETPGYLETPKGPELREDIENLAILRDLVGRSRSVPWGAPAPAKARGTGASAKIAPAPGRPLRAGAAGRRRSGREGGR